MKIDCLRLSNISMIELCKSKVLLEMNNLLPEIEDKSFDLSKNYIIFEHGNIMSLIPNDNGFIKSEHLKVILWCKKNKDKLEKLIVIFRKRMLHSFKLHVQTNDKQSVYKTVHDKRQYNYLHLLRLRNL